MAKDLSDIIVELMMVDVLPLCYSSLPSTKESHNFSHFLSSKFTLKLVKSTLGECIIRDRVKWFVRQMKTEVAVTNLLQYVRQSLLEVAGEDFTATGPDDTSWDQSFIGKPLHLLKLQSLSYKHEVPCQSLIRKKYQPASDRLDFLCRCW